MRASVGNAGAQINSCPCAARPRPLGICSFPAPSLRSRNSFWAAQCERSNAALDAVRCPYEILNIRQPLKATEEDIKASYRTLARLTHPDVNRTPEATLQFLEVQQAYAFLMDPAKRERYDTTLRPRSESVLTYLNTRAAVRAGFHQPTNGSSVIDEDFRLELYSSIRDLLRQARRTVRQVERELLGGTPEARARRTCASASQPGASSPSSADGSPRPSVLPATSVCAYEGLEAEPVEPWLYYMAPRAHARSAGRTYSAPRRERQSSSSS